MWKFADSTPLLEIIIRNTLLGRTYPAEDKRVMAVLDTGYSGFLLVPLRLFKTLGLHRLRSKNITAELADGLMKTIICKHNMVAVL